MAGRVEAPTRTFTASEAMVANRAVTYSTTADTVGYAGPGDRVIGITERDVASGDEVAVRLMSADGTHKITVNAAVSVGDKLFAAASGKYGATPGGGCQFVALSAGSGDGSVIEAVAVPEAGSALLYASTAASSAISGISTATAYDVSFTIPANTLEAGDVVDVWAQGIVTAENGADTHQFKLLIGSSVVAATPAIAVAANDIFLIHARIKIRTAGTAGTFTGSGITYIGTPGVAAGAADVPGAHFIASTAINTETTQAITVTSTVSAASGSNSSRLDDLTIIRHRK